MAMSHRPAGRLRLVALSLLAGAAVCLSGCSSSGPEAPGSSTATGSPSASDAPSTPSPSSASPTGAPRLLAYAGGESPGVVVRVPSDAVRIDGAPASFQAFIATTVEQLAAGATCDPQYVGVTVEFLRTDGYASGGVDDCGGHAALWALVDGSWAEVAATQDAWSCDVLERYGFPSDVVGDTCYDYAAQEERPYHRA